MPGSHRIPAVQSLVWSTDIDVLEIGCRVERRGAYWTITSPSNPEFWWGNFLLFDQAPADGDGARWEALFDAEVGGDPRVRHRAFGWDRTDGGRGKAEEEFGARGYVVELTAGLTATPAQLHRHPPENRDVSVRALEPTPGVDDELW